MKYSQSVALIACTLFAFAALADVSAGQSTTTPTNVNVTVNTTASDSAQSAQGSPSAQATTAPVSSSTTSSAPAAGSLGTSAGGQRADSIKKAREAVENRNDDKVVEKLEKARLDDEKQLGQNIDSTNLKDPAPADKQVTVEKVEIIQAAPIVQQQPAPVPQPPQQVQQVGPPQQQQLPAPPPVVAAPADTKPEEAKKEEEKRAWVAGVNTGSIMYSTGNIGQTSNVGVTVGKYLSDRVLIEGSFTYSKFDLNNFWNGTVNNLVFGSVEQYDIGAAVKYYVFDDKDGGSFHPYVGAAADYILRNYTDRYDYGFVYYQDNSQSQSTNSLNAGLLAGVDINITPRFIIGGEFKYSMPIYYEDNGLVTYSYLESYAKPIEQTAFSSWLLALKFKF